MKRVLVRRTPTSRFEVVKNLALTLTNVTLQTKYDGTPVLRLGGAFLAGLASHVSAEPDTLVVRMDVDERDLLLEDAPDTYYVTDYYQPYPVVLVRLSRVDEDALRDLLAVSYRLTLSKTRLRSSSEL